MILGRISYLDCAVFVLLLAPQLLFHVNILELVLCALQALPFFLVRLPFSFIKDRHFTTKTRQAPFVRQSSAFQDFVIRCVQYAFASLPTKIGQVFFSREVALPFLRFRMLRHGIWHCPIEWIDIDAGSLKGVLIRYKGYEPPDVIVYYLHGGGFALGSSHFYLEPMMALFTLLKERYRNPAIFSIDYSLVPHATYPTQLTEIIAGYNYVRTMIKGDSERICIAGDSAGGTLTLSLLLCLAKDPNGQPPGYAVLLSPWVTLLSHRHQDTRSDFLNAESLHQYGRQYAGTPSNIYRPLVSPGTCEDFDWWKKASPYKGLYITYGGEEVFAPEIRAFVKMLRRANVGVRVREEPGAVHAWVIASLFLEDSPQERVFGMKEVVKAISANILPGATNDASKSKEV